PAGPSCSTGRRSSAPSSPCRWCPPPAAPGTTCAARRAGSAARRCGPATARSSFPASACSARPRRPAAAAGPAPAGRGPPPPARRSRRPGLPRPATGPPPGCRPRAVRRDRSRPRPPAESTSRCRTAERRERHARMHPIPRLPGARPHRRADQPAVTWCVAVIATAPGPTIRAGVRNNEEAVMAVDESTLNELLGRFVTDLGGSFHAVNAVIGDRLGLYRALLAVMPATPAEVAEQAGVSERYTAEWLKGQAAGGYVSYDPATERFMLTEEQAFALAAPDGMQVAAAFHLPIAVSKNVDRITEAIRTGSGFGWHEHDQALFEGTERFFRPGYVANLVPEWIPALEGVEQKLHAGARIADVGCGHGASTLLFAETFPSSQVVGYDYHAASIDQARKRAAEAGLMSAATFDPLGAAKHIRQSPRPDGTFLLVEPYANDKVEDNLNPVGRLYYGASTVVCVAHSMTEEPRAALGAQAGLARLTELLTEAGFSRVRKAAETPFNLVIEARP